MTTAGGAVKGKRETQIDASTKQTTTAGVGYDKDKGMVISGGRSYESKKAPGKDEYGNDTEEKETGGFSGSISVKPGAFEGQGSFNVGGFTATASGGIEVVVKPPAAVGKKWVVEWKKTIKGGGSLGGTAGTSTKGGASVGVERSSVITGRRAYKTYEEAEHFYEEQKSNQARGFLDDEAIDDLASARGLEIGEERTSASSTTGTAGVTGEAGGVSLGVKVAGGIVDSMSVTRTGQDTYVVSLRIDKSGSVGGSMSAVGVSGGKSVKASASEFRAYTYDVSKSADKTAFEAVLATGDPGTRKATSVGHSTTTGEDSQVGLGPLAIAFGSSMTDSEYVDETGQTKSSVGENHMGFDFGIFGHSLATFSEREAMSVSEHTDLDGKKTHDFALTTEASGSSGTAVKQEIGKATHTNGMTSDDLGREVETSGAWTVTTHLSEGQMKLIIARLKDPEKRGNFTARIGDKTAVAAMVAKLTGDLMADARTVADFLRQYPDGLTAAYELLDLSPKQMAAQTEIDLAAKKGKDNAFLGGDGHRALAGRMLALQTRIDGGERGSALAGEIQKEIDDLRSRLLRVTKAAYPDLPDELLDGERYRMEKYVENLSAMLGAAMAEVEEMMMERLAGDAKAEKGLEEMYDVWSKMIGARDTAEAQWDELQDVRAEAEYQEHADPTGEMFFSSGATMLQNAHDLDSAGTKARTEMAFHVAAAAEGADAAKAGAADYTKAKSLMGKAAEMYQAAQKVLYAAQEIYQ